MNLLNQKIQAITYSIARLRRMETLTRNSGEKEEIRRSIRELNSILVDLLEQVGDN